MKVNIYSVKTLIYFNFKLSLNLGKDFIYLLFIRFVLKNFNNETFVL